MCAVVSNLSYLQLWNAHGGKTGTFWTESVSAMAAKWKSPESNVKSNRSALICTDVREQAMQGCPQRSHFTNTVAVKCFCRYLNVDTCPGSPHFQSITSWAWTINSLQYAIHYT